MNKDDEEKLTEQWRKETTHLNETVDEAFRKAQDVAYQIGVARNARFVSLVETIAANMENTALSDADFRTFVRNSLRSVVTPKNTPEENRPKHDAIYP